ncbi:MAG: helix-turn-helix domain-containing protein [Neptuniibacter sp.]
MQQPAQYEITHALKLAFKAQGVTYQKVAERIGVSEQTIKRLFKDKDCSLSRLSEVCNAINISLYDLLEVAKEFSEPLATLTAKQENWLASHPSHFHFLFFLISGYKAEEIKKNYQLSDITLFRYLRDLDRQELIELSANNSFRLKVEGKLLMRLNSQLAKLVRNRNHNFLDYVFDHHDDTNAWFSSSFRFMSADTLNAMQSDMEELMRRYQKAAYQDEAILPKDRLLPVKWSTIAAPFEICGQWPIETELT